jgi:hypothetical protein
MLYALLGLVGNSEPALLVPDYAKDWDTIFREFTQAWINHYGSLVIIAHPRLQRLTAWTTFERQRDANLEVLVFWNHGDDFGASPVPEFSASGKSRSPSCVYAPRPDVIVLKAFWADPIVDILDECEFFRWNWDTQALKFLKKV